MLPFDGYIRSDNRWVRLAKFIPWDKFEIAYSKSMTGFGISPPAVSVGIALGALIIKDKLGPSDEEPFIRLCLCTLESALARQDELDRFPIEGKFGQGKRRLSLSKIM